MTNRNSIAGKNVETLFCNSIGDNQGVINSIQEAFDLEGRYLKSIKTGIHGEKCDVKMSFADGRNVDANIKAYKPDAMFNQATRTTLVNFKEKIGLTEKEADELTYLFLEKAKGTNRPLIPMSLRNKWGEIIGDKLQKIVKWSLSSHPSREILVLYDRVESIMRLYKMTDVLIHAGSTVTFTPRGNIQLGNYMVLQRKGGDGNVTRYLKTELKHPSNDVQIKLDIKKFLEADLPLLARYSI